MIKHGKNAGLRALRPFSKWRWLLRHLPLYGRLSPVLHVISNSGRVRGGQPRFSGPCDRAMPRIARDSRRLILVQVSLLMIASSESLPDIEESARAGT